MSANEAPDGLPQRRGRGRPPGLFGSSLLRQALRHERQNRDAASVVSVGRPRRLSSTPEQAVVTDDVRIDSCKPLQQLLLLHSRAQSAEKPTTTEQADAANNPASAILSCGRRHLLSQQASMEQYNNSDIRRVASTIIQSSAALWAKVLDRIVGLLESGWSGLALSVCRRYDETPLFLRVAEEDKTESQQQDSQQQDSQQQQSPKLSGFGGTGQGKKSCKIMQSEMRLSAVLKHNASGQKVQLKGKIPTFLQSLETTKAEQIARCQMDMLSDSIPDLNELGRFFEFKQFLTCTDRFTANISAEKHIQAKHPGWVRTHNTCNVHKLSGAEKSMSELVAGQMGGMVAVGMAMKNAGVTRELRKCLMAILEKELCVVFGQPKAVAQRAALYDIFLPMSGDYSTEVGQSAAKQSQASKSVTNHKRRLILSFFLNGDISDEEKICHYTTVSTDRTQVLANMEKYLVPVLLPKACPVLNRSKWLGAEATFSYLGILLSHHGLFTKLMVAWRGSAKEVVASDDLGDGPSLGPGLGSDWAKSWGGIAASFVGHGSCPNTRTRTRTAGIDDDDDDDGLLLDDEDDDKFNPQTIFDPVSGDVNWQEQNKATIQKAVAWAESKPGNTVLVICMAWQPVLKLMHRMIFLGSEDFEKQQRAEVLAGRQRTYKSLELYLANDANEFWRSVNKLLHSVPEALPAKAWVSYNKTLLFRLVSRSACAVHQMFAARHKLAPFMLFSALWGLSDAQQVAQCMQDELTQYFAKHYDGDKLFESDAQCLLAAIAGLCDYDIVGIEVRHAASRRISLLRSCQTHTMAFQDLSAEFVCRQHVILREQPRKHYATDTAQKAQAKCGSSSKTKKGRRKRKSRGGAWRAYLHHNFQGQQFTSQLLQRAARDYRAMKADNGPEFEFYRNLGILGTLAGRQGHLAYKKFLPPPPDQALAVVSASPLSGLFDELNKLAVKKQEAHAFACALAEEQLALQKEACTTAAQDLSSSCGLELGKLLSTGDIVNFDSDCSGGIPVPSYAPPFVAQPGSLNTPSVLDFFVPADVVAIESFLALGRWYPLMMSTLQTVHP